MKFLHTVIHHKQNSTPRALLKNSIRTEKKIYEGSEGAVHRITFCHSPEGIVRVGDETMPDTVVYKRYFVPQSRERKALEELNGNDPHYQRQHHHVVHLYGYTKDDSSILVESFDTDLFEWYIKHYSSMTEDTFWSIAEQLLEGVQYCHSRHIAHTDIKLENIGVIIREDNHIEVYLLDFGHAIDVTTTKTRTVRGECVMGSVPYTAPEAILHDELELNDTYAIDYWEVGVVLYSILEGEFPFSPTVEQSKKMSRKSADKITRTNICAKAIQWHKTKNEGGKKLVAALLDKNSQTRLNFDMMDVDGLKAALTQYRNS